MSRPHANESVFRALAHPTRRKVIEILLKSERSPLELQDLVRVPLPTLSHHLTILRTSGLVRQQRRGRFRVYSAVMESMRGASAWFRLCESMAGR